MNKRSLLAHRIAFPCAILGAGGIFLLAVLGAAAFPGYSHVSQFISELGATGAPHEMLVRFGGFLPAGIFLCVFAVAAFMSLPRSGLTTFGLVGMFIYAGGYVASAFFPCDAGCRPAQPSLSQIIHNAAGLAGYALAPLSLLALGWRARKWPGEAWPGGAWPGGGQLAAIGMLSAALSLVGLLTLSPKSPYVGLSQRVIEASVLLWVVMCGIYIRSRRQDANWHAD